MRVQAITRRAYWVAELANLSGSFGNDSNKMAQELREEIARDGKEALLDHLRLCGAVPEKYPHDSSEEKLYSKYTDAVVSEFLQAIGLQSIIIHTRADAADVQARGKYFSLVADAKAFRLSRTAKNQKDFKVQAMDGWRNGLDYALILCPIYQLPTRTSQIYQQAISRNVCILSYSHLAALLNLALQKGFELAEKGLGNILKIVSVLHPGKNAADYWTGINRALVESLGENKYLWTAEKILSLESIDVVRNESLKYLNAERSRLLGLSHREALDELLRISGLDSRIDQVERMEHGGLLEV